MAPHKTPRNKKQQNVLTSYKNGASPATSPTKEMLPVRFPTVSQPTETYEKAQEDEREVLKAIFMEDYEELEATGAWSVSMTSLPFLRDTHRLRDVATWLMGS
jgi:translation initiation factor 2-alpha kinase 4